MPIYDNDGTANREIGTLYDYNGSVNTQIGKVYDNNGTTNSLIYSAEEVYTASVSIPLSRTGTLENDNTLSAHTYLMKSIPVGRSFTINSVVYSAPGDARLIINVGVNNYATEVYAASKLFPYAKTETVVSNKSYTSTTATNTIYIMGRGNCLDRVYGVTQYATITLKYTVY